jgi:hypothetical protein
MNVHPSFLAKRRKPTFKLPPGTTDAHCHVFGPGAVFPYAPNRRYTPDDAPKEMLRALHDHLGISRAVIVQASCHGTDNLAMLDCIASDPKRYRGVAIVDDGFTDADFDRLDKGGVRGVRSNFVKHLGGAPDMVVFNRVFDRIKGRGWHVVLHLDAPSVEPLSAMMRALPLPFIVDHMGRVPGKDGVDQPPLKALLELAKLAELLDQGVRRRTHFIAALRRGGADRARDRRGGAGTRLVGYRFPASQSDARSRRGRSGRPGAAICRFRAGAAAALGGQSGPALWFRLTTTRNAKFSGGSR